MDEAETPISNSRIEQGRSTDQQEIPITGRRSTDPAMNKNRAESLGKHQEIPVDQNKDGKHQQSIGTSMRKITTDPFLRKMPMALMPCQIIWNCFSLILKRMTYKDIYRWLIKSLTNLYKVGIFPSKSFTNFKNNKSPNKRISTM